MPKPSSGAVYAVPSMAPVDRNVPRCDSIPVGRESDVQMHAHIPMEVTFGQEDAYAPIKGFDAMGVGIATLLADVEQFF